MRLARNLRTLLLVVLALVAALTVGGCDELLCVGEDDFGSTVAWNFSVGVFGYLVLGLLLSALLETTLRLGALRQSAARYREPALISALAVALGAVGLAWITEGSWVAYGLLIVSSAAIYALLYELPESGDPT